MNKYNIEEKIGFGSYGNIYSAKDLISDEVVVIKEINYERLSNLEIETLESEVELNLKIDIYY